MLLGYKLELGKYISFILFDQYDRILGPYRPEKVVLEINLWVWNLVCKPTCKIEDIDTYKIRNQLYTFNKDVDSKIYTLNVNLYSLFANELI